MKVKYPKTPYLRVSLGREWGKPGTSLVEFKGRDLVITEKLDGSNVSLSIEGVFSRSGDTPTHSSFDALKAFHAQIAWTLPDDIILFGEWCEAVHTFRYPDLSSETPADRLFIFAIYEKATMEFLSWSDTKYIVSALGLNLVPVLSYVSYDSYSYTSYHLYRDLIDLFGQDSSLGGDMEGIVLRDEDCFSYEEFQEYTAKYSKNFEKGKYFTKNYERQGGVSSKT